MRYLKNKYTINEDEQTMLSQKGVAIIGCGGLGQYIASQLCRVGIGWLTIVDHDVFEESNLNRQLFSNVENIGKPKAIEAENQLKLINPDVKIKVFQERFTSDFPRANLESHELVIDALDSAIDRLTLQQVCKEINLPLISAAIAGWYGQITLIRPGDDTLNLIYKENGGTGMEKILGNPAFTPALTASLQVTEAVKYLLKKPTLKSREVLYIDLFDMLFTKKTLTF